MVRLGRPVRNPRNLATHFARPQLCHRRHQGACGDMRLNQHRGRLEFPPNIAAALNPYREITRVVASLVLLPIVLMFRYPSFTADQQRLMACS